MKALLIAGLAAGAGLALAAQPIHYDVSFRMSPPTAVVRMKLPEKSEARELRMPAWRPGDYFQFDFGKTVRSVTFYKDDEIVDRANSSNPNVFRAAEPFDMVEYTVSPSRSNFTDNLLISSDLIFVSTAAILGWPDSRQYESVELKVQSPTDEFRALMGFSDPSAKPVRANNLESLGDIPIVLAKKLDVAGFEQQGIKHQFVAFGNLGGYESARFTDLAGKAAKAAFSYFGSFPYPAYTFYAHIGGFPAGLEGAEACRIGLWSADADSASGLIFHEYLHSYNVKHIRPKSLRPIDLANPPAIETLWWLEGGTDYLADLLRYRARVITKDEFLSEMESAYLGMSRRGGGGYQTTSLLDSSLKVWQTIGSQGFGGVSYYTKGKAVCFLLDLAIRRESAGLKSLDDVFQKLYAETGPDRPGYNEDRIRELCVEAGGSRVGVLYDLIVKTTAPLPWLEVLNRAGFTTRDGKIQLFEQAEPIAKTIAKEYPDPTVKGLF